MKVTFKDATILKAFWNLAKRVSNGVFGCIREDDRAVLWAGNNYSFALASVQCPRELESLPNYEGRQVTAGRATADGFNVTLESIANPTVILNIALVRRMVNRATETCSAQPVAVDLQPAGELGIVIKELEGIVVDPRIAFGDGKNKVGMIYSADIKDHPVGDFIMLLCGRAFTAGNFQPDEAVERVRADAFRFDPPF